MLFEASWDGRASALLLCWRSCFCCFAGVVDGVTVLFLFASLMERAL